MPGRYPSFATLVDRGVAVRFSDAAFRLRWRLCLTATPPKPTDPTYKTYSQYRDPTVLTTWRILPVVPGSDGSDLTAYREDDADFFSAGSPWSDAHAIATASLTDPPIGSIDIRIFCLETYADDLWPTLHKDCYHREVDADACEDGSPAYRAPGPLRIEPAAGCDFVTIGDYVRAVGRWMESDVVAGDLARWWPQMEYMPGGKAVANGWLSPGSESEIHLDVHHPRAPGSVVRNRQWVRYHQEAMLPELRTRRSANKTRSPNWIIDKLNRGETRRTGAPRTTNGSIDSYPVWINRSTTDSSNDSSLPSGDKAEAPGPGASSVMAPSSSSSSSANPLALTAPSTPPMVPGATGGLESLEERARFWLNSSVSLAS